jgi:hypothetical protein
VHDELPSGANFQALKAFDNWHIHGISALGTFRITGENLVDAMTPIYLERDLPYAITVDKGTKPTSQILEE